MLLQAVLVGCTSIVPELAMHLVMTTTSALVTKLARRF